MTRAGLNLGSWGDRADGYGQGAYEVWTIALENAYGQFIGWSDLIDGGSPADVWDHITAEPASTEDADQYTNEQLVNNIQNAFNSGQKVVLGTRDLPEFWGQNPNSGDTIPNYERRQ